MANALVAKPQFVVRETGNLFAVTLDGIRDIPKIRVWWQEYLRQCWFIAKVTSIPVMLISIPFGMVIALHVGSFSRQLGAESATGAASRTMASTIAAPVEASAPSWRANDPTWRAMTIPNGMEMKMTGTLVTLAMNQHWRRNSFHHCRGWSV